MSTPAPGDQFTLGDRTCEVTHVHVDGLRPRVIAKITSTPEDADPLAMDQRCQIGATEYKLLRSTDDTAWLRSTAPKRRR